MLWKHHHWLFLRVLQLGSSLWGRLVSVPCDAGWHHSTGPRGSTILMHMSGASAVMAMVGWVSLFLFSQPLSIQWSNSGFCTWKLCPRRAENGSHSTSRSHLTSLPLLSVGQSKSQDKLSFLKRKIEPTSLWEEQLERRKMWRNVGSHLFRQCNTGFIDHCVL